MPDLEGLGEVATGVLVARAVEPGAGEANGHTPEANCLNCGAALVGDYCHDCGQRGHVHRTIGAFLHDLLHGVFHFEGKIWNTLPMLAWRPGQLTSGYIGGQRARYVSPIALFLFSVFLMFAMFGAIGGGFDVSGLVNINRVDVQLKDRRETVAKLEQQRNRLIQTKGSTASADSRLRAASDDIRVLELMRDKGVVEGSLSQPNSKVTSKSEWFNQAYIDAKKNPSLLFYKLRTNAYKFSWALIPLSVPLMWLMCPFSRRFRAYDHTVFVTYSLAFMTMLTIVVSIAVMLGLKWIVIVLVLYAPVHMYRQLKVAYGLSRASALWRTGALLIVACIALALFGFAILALGISE